MIDLAVANDTETFQRMRDPLAERGVQVHHVPASERTVDLADPPWSPDEYDAAVLEIFQKIKTVRDDVVASIPIKVHDDADAAVRPFVRWVGKTLGTLGG